MHFRYEPFSKVSYLIALQPNCESASCPATCSIDVGTHNSGSKTVQLIAIPTQASLFDADKNLKSITAAKFQLRKLYKIKICRRGCDGF
jgi:hypothetical protein